MECPRFSYFPQFLLPFHLSVLGRMEEGCPLRGTPGPTSSLVIPSPPRTHSTSQGLPLCPRCVHCQCCACPVPLPHSGTMSSVGPRSHGVGPDWGPRRGGGGRDKDAQLPHVGARWGGVPEEEEGVPSGYFSIFYFQIFFVSKLADLYYTRTANKGRI